MYERTALPGGPRVISARLPATRALSIAAYVPVGARHERSEQAGIAHFLEHLTFRGTRGLPDSRAVSEAIEGVGGSANAATERESTVYWARLPIREAERAADVIADLTLRPLLRSEDIEHERSIIIEEIRSYRDDPAQHVHDLWDQTFFGVDTSLGREIAGDEATVAGLTDTAIRDFWAAGYVAGALVVAIAGDLSHEDAVGLVAGRFGGMAGAAPTFPAAPAAPRGRLTIEERETAQAHVCLGLPGLRRDHPDQFALELLDTVLGGGASSRLFLSVREEKGLAYDVHSFQTDYADSGALQVYLGVDPADVGAAVGAVLDELARLRDERIAADELERARNHTIGRTELRLEESRAMAAFIGTQEALHERVMTTDEVVAAISAVTADAIADLAARLIHDDGLCAAVIGPGIDRAALERSLRLP